MDSTVHQDYFTHFEQSQSVGWAKTGDPREKPPGHPLAELGLSHDKYTMTVFRLYNFQFEVESCIDMIDGPNTDVVVVCSGLRSLSTIFHSHYDGVWLRQGAQCSLLLWCISEVSC